MPWRKSFAFLRIKRFVGRRRAGRAMRRQTTRKNPQPARRIPQPGCSLSPASANGSPRAMRLAATMNGTSIALNSERRLSAIDAALRHRGDSRFLAGSFDVFLHRPRMTMHLTRAFATLSAVAMLGISNANAQNARVYAGAAGMLAIQGAHRQGSAPSLPTSGAEGTAIGITAEVGTLLTPRISLGVELGLPRRFTSVQEVDYLRVFQHESRHRDMTISAVVRATATPAHGLQLGIVAGGGFVQESTRQRRRDQLGLLPTFPPVFGPYSDEYSFTRWTVAAVVGADVEVAITSRVAIVPQIRAHVVRRASDTSQQSWALGLNSVIWRPAIGLRAAF